MTSCPITASLRAAACVVAVFAHGLVGASALADGPAHVPARNAPMAREPAAAKRGDKKLIQLGWDEPSTAEMRRAARRMDASGFDGVVFHPDVVVDGKVDSFGGYSWGKHRFSFSEFTREVENLRACNFKKLKHNFLRFNVYPGDAAWFDDAEIGAVIENARVAARVAREGNAAGIMFDPEMYYKHPFTYFEQPDRALRSFREYEERVEQKGREFMRALNSEYPDITVLLTYGYGLTGFDGDRSKHYYGLLKNFLDGMLAAATADTKIVDGYEFSYGFRRLEQFRHGYRRVKEEFEKGSAYPELYRRLVRVGFGVWLDNRSDRHGWSDRDFQRNHFTPDELTYAVASALRETDGYVWLYSERTNWWKNNIAPMAYRDVPRRARLLERVARDQSYPDRKVMGDDVRASAQPGHDEAKTFAGLPSSSRIVATLPKAWQFRLDRGDVGARQRWYIRPWTANSWRPIEVGRFWEETYEPYQGVAWYRLEWTAPTSSAATLALVFGAVDEAATVWVNGGLVGQHDVGPEGWDQRFSVDVTGKLIPGKKNVIVVKVRNDALAGGIWKSIKLVESEVAP